MTDYLIPNLQKDKIIECLRENLRLSGRKSDEYREIKVETGISKNAEASVKVTVGKTEVLAGVKLSVVEPYPDSPAEGTFMTTVELHPMASQSYELGKPGIDSVEIARVIDRGIRESGFIDFEKLCIEEGKKVWQVFLDIVTLNDDGNMLDVAGLAGLIAIGNTKMPKYNKETGKIEPELTKEKLPINKEALSFNMTLHKIGDKIVVDVDKEEEAISDYRLSIAIGENNGSPRITAMQKGKPGAISEKDMENILNVAINKWKEIFPKVKEYVFTK